MNSTLVGNLNFHTVGFHNFNLRILNSRVSNPNKFIVKAFLTRCRISMCQSLGPKKHDEISEIDRTCALPSRKTHPPMCPQTFACK